MSEPIWLSDYDYHLPEELIAQEPLEDRAGSRLLHVELPGGHIHHRQFRDSVDLLESGDVLVMNDTRVSALRLHGHKPTGGAVEALLLRETEPGVFLALVKPGKRLHQGAVMEFAAGLVATVVDELAEGLRHIQFHQEEGWRDRLQRAGEVPLPPYIHARLQDPERYQTVYNATPGSAAAPTAGLHFTPQILDSLRHKGVEIQTVTLDVSIDTFRPVSVENAREHRIHGETCRISKRAARVINHRSGRLIAVGTTSVRTLETFANEVGQVAPGEAISTLYITPDRAMRAVQGMFTNFHLPKTTMLLMVSALCGREKLMEAYKEAVENRYRFLSFGDSMLLM